MVALFRGRGPRDGWARRPAGRLPGARLRGPGGRSGRRRRRAAHRSRPVHGRRGPRAARGGLAGADQQLRPPARARLEDAARAGGGGEGTGLGRARGRRCSARSPNAPASSAAASPSGGAATRSSPSARSSPPAAATPRSSLGSPIPTSDSSCGPVPVTSSRRASRRESSCSRWRRRSSAAAPSARAGASFSTGGTSSSSLAIVYGDGRRTDLAFTALARNGLLERLHVLAAGEPGGRRPGPISLTPAVGAEEGEEGADDRGGRRDCRRGRRGDDPSRGRPPRPYRSGGAGQHRLPRRPGARRSRPQRGLRRVSDDASSTASGGSS